MKPLFTESDIRKYIESSDKLSVAHELSLALLSDGVCAAGDHDLMYSTSSQQYLIKTIKTYILAFIDKREEEVVYGEDGDRVKGYTLEEQDTIATSICKYVLHIEDQQMRDAFLEYKGGMIGKFQERALEEMESRKVIEEEELEEEYIFNVIDNMLDDWEKALTAQHSKRDRDSLGQLILSLCKDTKHYNKEVHYLRYKYNNGALTKYITA